MTQSLLGLLLGLAILFIPFMIRGMGAGDVKMLALVGAVKGPVFVFYTAVGMALAGGIMAAAVLLYKAGFFTQTTRFFKAVWLMLISGFKIREFNLASRMIMIPYGLAITLGAAGAFWWMR